ncbi:hypothetical protein [Actinomadura meridiana]
MPGRTNGWWISPAIPTIANVVLAVLWTFSALGGWGDAAFCGEGDQHDAACGTGFVHAVQVSAPLAALAAIVAVTAWSMPSVRRRPDRLDALLTMAAFVWILAEGILFIGGYLAKS